MHVIAGMGMTKSHSDANILQSGYGDDPETLNNKQMK